MGLDHFRARRRRSRTVVILLAAMVFLMEVSGAGISTAVPAAHSGTARTDSADVTSEAEAAAAKAAETGHRVEVVGERTEYTTTYANPDGSTFSLSMSAVPVRVK